MDNIVGIFAHFDYKIIEIPYKDDYAEYNPGDLVIYKDEEGRDAFGDILYVNKPMPDDVRILKNGALLRKATLHDQQIIEANNQREVDALTRCKGKIEEHGLDMQLIIAKYSLDGLRLNFVFTADGRVDFRELVKDLAKTFKKQIHLQQIGPRDKARAISGYGKCGRQFCCRGHLRQLESITMDAVRDQNLASKGSSKLSGVCGKLLCCLNYEMDLYKELKKKSPAIESIIKTKKGIEGKVIGVDILNQKLRVLFGNKDTNIEMVDVADVKVIKEPPRKSKKKNSPELEEEVVDDDATISTA